MLRESRRGQSLRRVAIRVCSCYAVRMTAVVGRDRELADIASFLEAGDGARRVLLIEGEAGIGKTTLWRAGLDAARDRGYPVLTCVGVRDSAFVRGVSRPRRRRLRRGVRHASAAAARGDGGRPPARATERAPADIGDDCCCFPVDVAGARCGSADARDVQWLDPSSATVLGYALRRLNAEPLPVLLSRRTDEESSLLALDRLDRERLQVLHVGSLTIGALGNILHARLGVTPARPTLRAPA